MSHRVLGRQFFHGSDVKHEIGTELTGGHPIAFSRDMPEDLRQEHNSYVWMHDSPEKASFYGQHLYQVHPHAPEIYEPDLYEEDDDPGDKRWVTPKATVVRRGQIHRGTGQVHWE